MEHDDQGTRIAGESGDKRGRPQRLAGRQRAGYGASRDSKEGRLVARRWTANTMDMPGDVELRIVDPHRPAATRRC
jgi:hypothetical protein